MKFNIYNKDELSLELARFIIAEIISGYIDKSCISLALSGGTTPRKAYEWLGKYFCAEEILGEGRELYILQVDERYISMNNHRSNQRMIREALNCEKEKQLILEFMPTTDNTNSLDQAINEYDQRLSKILIDHLDIIVLGMGADGHTASLFPNNREYIRSIQTGQRVLGTYINSQKENRISLTARVISEAKLKILLITGIEKGITLARAEKSNDHINFPIKQGLDRNTVIFMDEECHKAYIEEKLK